MVELERRIGSLVSAVCGVEAATLQRGRDLREYGMDSVRAMDLVVQLEEAFAVSIPDEKLAELRTLADIAHYVTRERQAARAVRDARSGIAAPEREARAGGQRR